MIKLMKWKIARKDPYEASGLSLYFLSKTDGTTVMMMITKIMKSTHVEYDVMISNFKQFCKYFVS